MERKSYEVNDLSASGGGKFLQLLDEDGKPFAPPEQLGYKLLDDDGNVLAEGTLNDQGQIPLDGVDTEKFDVEIEHYNITETKGFDFLGDLAPAEEEDDDGDITGEGASGESGSDDEGSGGDSDDDDKGASSDDSDDGDDSDSSDGDDDSDDQSSSDDPSSGDDDKSTSSDDDKDEDDEDKSAGTGDEKTDDGGTDDEDSDSGKN